MVPPIRFDNGRLSGFVERDELAGYIGVGWNGFDQKQKRLIIERSRAKLLGMCAAAGFDVVKPAVEC